MQKYKLQILIGDSSQIVNLIILYYIDVSYWFRRKERRNDFFASQRLEMTDGRSKYNIGMCAPLKT